MSYVSMLLGIGEMIDLLCRYLVNFMRKHGRSVYDRPCPTGFDILQINSLCEIVPDEYI